MIHALVLVMCLALCGTSYGTNYSSNPFGRSSGWFVPVGVSAGNTGDMGKHAGIEASACYYSADLRFIGVYSDFLFREDSDNNQVSGGIEFGALGFGVDIGYYRDMNHNSGFLVRPFVWIMGFMPYVRIGIQDDEYFEFGCLFKYPLDFRHSW